MRRRFTATELDEVLLLLDGSRFGEEARVARRLGRKPHAIYAKLCELRARGLTFAERRRLAELKADRTSAADRQN
jgi:hypothetical protein